MSKKGKERGLGEYGHFLGSWQVKIADRGAGETKNVGQEVKGNWTMERKREREEEERGGGRKRGERGRRKRGRQKERRERKKKEGEEGGRERERDRERIPSGIGGVN